MSMQYRWLGIPHIWMPGIFSDVICSMWSRCFGIVSVNLERKQLTDGILLEKFFLTERNQLNDRILLQEDAKCVIGSLFDLLFSCSTCCRITESTECCSSDNMPSNYTHNGRQPCISNSLPGKEYNFGETRLFMLERKKNCILLSNLFWIIGLILTIFAFRISTSSRVKEKDYFSSSYAWRNKAWQGLGL